MLDNNKLNFNKRSLMKRNNSRDSFNIQTKTRNVNSDTDKDSVRSSNVSFNTSTSSSSSSIDNLNLEKILHRKNTENIKKFNGNLSIISLKNDDAVMSFLLYLKTKYDIVMNSGNKYFKFMDTDDVVTTLKSIEHVVCFNTNPKYVLLLFTRIKNTDVYIYILKSTNEIFIVNYKTINVLSSEEEFILEGEIINDSCLLVSDLLVHEGKKNNDDMTIKKSKIETIINGIDTSKGLKIKMKEFVSIEHTVSFVRDVLPTIEYKDIVNGLVFRPISGTRNKNIILILNKPFHTLKLSKPQATTNVLTQHSKLELRENIQNVVFYGVKTSRGPDIIDLYLSNKRDELIKYGTACVPTIQNSLTVQNIFSSKHQCLLECVFNTTFNAFVIVQESEKLKSSLVESITL